MESPRRFCFVDALRGIAAFSVVLFHAIAGGHVNTFISLAPYPVAFILRHGDLGVAIFFVLSGFVISHSLYRERVTFPLLARFMLRRSIRLDPPYWMAMAVTILFSLLSMRFVADKSAVLSTNQLIAHLFYVQEILGYPEINPVFWTLCLEVQFYILYGLMLAVSRNNPAAPLQGVYTIATLSLACLVSLLWPTGVITSSFWPGGFLPLWYAFLVGSAAYWTWKNVVLTPYFIGFLLVLGGFAIFRGDNFAVVSVATAVSLWAAGATQKIYSALGWRWLQWLGAISYSLYLIHNPVTGASFRVGYMLTGSGVIFQAVWWFVSLIACLVAAYLFWRLVERPSMGLAKLILLRGRPGNPSTNVLNVPNRL